MLWPVFARLRAYGPFGPGVSVPPTMDVLVAWHKRMLEDPSVKSILHPDSAYQEFSKHYRTDTTKFDEIETENWEETIMTTLIIFDSLYRPICNCCCCVQTMSCKFSWWWLRSSLSMPWYKCVLFCHTATILQWLILCNIYFCQCHTATITFLIHIWKKGEWWGDIQNKLSMNYLSVWACQRRL